MAGTFFNPTVSRIKPSNLPVDGGLFLTKFFRARQEGLSVFRHFESTNKGKNQKNSSGRALEGPKFLTSVNNGEVPLGQKQPCMHFLVSNFF